MNPTLLPANLGSLAQLAAREDGARYALSAVHVSTDATEPRLYRAEATDGKVLGVVTGTADDGAQYPALPALESAPNGENTALVPIGEWTRAFRSVPTGRARVKPILGNVAAVFGKDVATLATTDLASQHVVQPRNADGRFPAVECVIPRKVPLARVRLNVKMLTRLLKVAAEFTDDDGCIVLELHEATKPVVVRTETAQQKFTGLIMPCGLPPAIPAECATVAPIASPVTQDTAPTLPAPKRRRTARRAAPVATATPEPAPEPEPQVLSYCFHV